MQRIIRALWSLQPIPEAAERPAPATTMMCLAAANASVNLVTVSSLIGTDGSAIEKEKAEISQ